jgi:DNA-binding response OmpR family regulator
MMKKRILVVEDDTSLARVLRDNLAFDGFDVDWVTSGHAALKRVKVAAPDLVVLDIMLPDTSGFDLCGLLRQGRQTPIIILTARGQKADKVRGLNLGADDYITKPYSPKELRARIRAHLRRTSDAGLPQIIAFGDCELDLGRAELRRDRKPVATTPLELKMLEFFTRRVGRVLTRRTLIDEVWGRDTAITERVVDNQIANLRKKIEPSPAAPRFLKSVRGIGYRFDLEDVTES